MLVDIIRLVCVALVNIIIPITHTSPNINNEMGQQKNDNIQDGGKIDNFFVRFSIINSLYVLFGLLHLLVDGADPLNYADWVIMIIIIAGFSLRMWCYYHLGSSFTFILGTRDDHKLIKDGPYKYIMHPGYTGQLMVIFGTAIFFQMYYTLVPIIIYEIIIAKKRLIVEEQMLKDRFGGQYDKYLSERWRFIPFLI